MTQDQIKALPHRMVDGVAVLLTDQELAARAAEEEAWNAGALDRAKADAAVAIDVAAGRTRQKYITTVPGQEATYLLKAQQADAFKAAGYAGPVPGLVAAEVTATGAAARQACDAILAERDLWAAIAAQVEAARRGGKVAAAAAATVKDVQAARDGALRALGLL
jgi:hypothetical protein